MKNGFWLGLFISGELIFGGAFCFKMGWLDMTIKTANSNSSCAYIWEDSLSEGYLRLRFGWLFIFGRACYRNLTVCPELNSSTKFAKTVKIPCCLRQHVKRTRDIRVIFVIIFAK